MCAQTCRTSFGCNTPLSAQGWFPVSETSFHPLKSTGAFPVFWISTYSAGLSTAIIRTEPLRDTVGGRVVFVGSGMAVPVGICVAVAGLGVVGNALGTTRVGRGVKPKPNNAVGVGCVPSGVKRVVSGVSVGEFRAPAGTKRKRIEQRQQNTSRNKVEKSILPNWPCWLYFAFNKEINEFNCSTSIYQ